MHVCSSPCGFIQSVLITIKLSSGVLCFFLQPSAATIIRKPGSAPIIRVCPPVSTPKPTYAIGGLHQRPSVSSTSGPTFHRPSAGGRASYRPTAAVGTIMQRPSSNVGPIPQRPSSAVGTIPQRLSPALGVSCQQITCTTGTATMKVACEL